MPGVTDISPVVLWSLALISLAVVWARRRSVAILLVSLQSVILGVAALIQSAGHDGELLVAAALLVVKGLALPLLLLATVSRTREPARLRSERPQLLRTATAAAIAVAAALLMPGFGLSSHALQDTAVAMVMLGIWTASERRSVLIQAAAFLLAENGVYLAGLGTRAMPALIEVGLGADLIVILGVAVAFGGSIHTLLGSSDTSLMERLRD